MHKEILTIEEKSIFASFLSVIYEFAPIFEQDRDADFFKELLLKHEVSNDLEDRVKIMENFDFINAVQHKLFPDRESIVAFFNTAEKVKKICKLNDLYAQLEQLQKANS